MKTQAQNKVLRYDDYDDYDADLAREVFPDEDFDGYDVDIDAIRAYLGID